MSSKEDIDVLDSVLESASEGYDFVVETDDGDITFEMRRVSRVRRQQFIETLPDELVEYMTSQAEEQDRNVSDIEDMDDIRDAAPDESDAPTDSMIGAHEVEEMQDLIVESLHHSQITDSELRDFMELWPDSLFYITTFLILAISGEAHGVEGFRSDFADQKKNERRKERRGA